MGDKADEKLKDFYIPDYVLVGGSMPNIKVAPSCPVIVFVNGASGGQLGGELLHTYRALLNENQVSFSAMDIERDCNRRMIDSVNSPFRYLTWEKSLLTRCFTSSMLLWKHSSAAEMFWLLIS